MLVITRSHVDARLSRNADLLAEAARDRLTAAATQPSHSTMPRPVGLIRLLLRYDALLASVAAVASLLALVSIG